MKPNYILPTVLAQIPTPVNGDFLKIISGKVGIFHYTTLAFAGKD
jgi:hypothetical protein